MVFESSRDFSLTALYYGKIRIVTCISLLICLVCQLRHAFSRLLISIDPSITRLLVRHALIATDQRHALIAADPRHALIVTDPRHAFIAADPR